MKLTKEENFFETCCTPASPCKEMREFLARKEKQKPVTGKDCEKRGNMEKEIFLVVQEGGSSLELYLHSFDTVEQAENYRTECDNEGGYRTTPPVKALEGIEKHFPAIEELLRSIKNLE